MGGKIWKCWPGLQVKTKAVERVSEALGAQIEQQNQQEQKQILSGKVVCFASQAQIPNLYVAIDGSGVPVVARETEGRKGKDPTGKAKTREAWVVALPVRLGRHRSGALQPRGEDLA